jgi:hypothetical protein
MGLRRYSYHLPPFFWTVLARRAHQHSKLYHAKGAMFGGKLYPSLANFISAEISAVLAASGIPNVSMTGDVLGTTSCPRPSSTG